MVCSPPFIYLFIYFFFQYVFVYCYPLLFGEDLKDVNKIYKFTFPSQEQKGMVSMWCVCLSIPFVWNKRRSRQFSDFINTKCVFFLDLNSFKGTSLHMLRLPIITVLFIMFISPSKLKLNLSGVLLNLKTIIKIWYTVFTNGGHAGKNWCLVMKARRWRINKNCKWRLSVNLQSV